MTDLSSLRAMSCRVVASEQMAGVAPALLRASDHLRPVEAGEKAQLTLVVGTGHDDVNWDGVAALAADPEAGSVVVCVRNLDDAVIAAAGQVGAAATLSLQPAAQAFEAELLDALTPLGTLPPAPCPDGHRFPDLSQMESKVVTLISTGATNQEIADQLFLSQNTVKTYIRTAYRKMGVTRRSQAVAWAFREGAAGE